VALTTSDRHRTAVQQPKLVAKDALPKTWKELSSRAGKAASTHLRAYRAGCTTLQSIRDVEKYGGLSDKLARNEVFSGGDRPPRPAMRRKRPEPRYELRCPSTTPHVREGRQAR